MRHPSVWIALLLTWFHCNVDTNLPTAPGSSPAVRANWGMVQATFTHIRESIGPFKRPPIVSFDNNHIDSTANNYSAHFRVNCLSIVPLQVPVRFGLARPSSCLPNRHKTPPPLSRDHSSHVPYNSEQCCWASKNCWRVSISHLPQFIRDF